MDKEKGIWHGGTTKPNGQDKRMSEEEARFWRGFEDYNDNVGIESDFAPEYQLEKEMRNDKTPVSGMGGVGGPIASLRYQNQKEENQ